MHGHISTICIMCMKLMRSQADLLLHTLLKGNNGKAILLNENSFIAFFTTY